MDTTASGFDHRALIAARNESLITLAKDPNYKFSDHSIRIETFPNSGMETFEGKEIVNIDEIIDINKEDPFLHVNSCFFIAFKHGLKKYGVTHLYDLPITVTLLKIISGFEIDEQIDMHHMVDMNAMVDMDSKIIEHTSNHRQCLQQLLNHFPDFEIHFFMGVNKHDAWHTTQISQLILPNDGKRGRKIIRILNENGIHFELIISDDNLFVPPIIDLTASIYNGQNNIIKEYRNTNLSVNSLVYSNYVFKNPDEINYLNKIEEQKIIQMNKDKILEKIQQKINYEKTRAEELQQKNQLVGNIKETFINKIYGINSILNQFVKQQGQLVKSVNDAVCNHTRLIETIDGDVIKLLENRDSLTYDQQNFIDEKIKDSERNYTQLLQELTKYEDSSLDDIGKYLIDAFKTYIKYKEMRQ